MATRWNAEYESKSEGPLKAPRKYLLIDHHEKNACIANVLPVGRKWFAMDKSAAGLVWEMQYNGIIEMPSIVRAIQARDIWRKDTVHECEELLLGYHALVGDCVVCRLDLVDNYKDWEGKLLAYGRPANAERKRTIDAYAKAAFRCRIGKHLGWAVNCNDITIVSEVGHAILDSRNDFNRFSATFRAVIPPDKDVPEDQRGRIAYLISLRSAETGVNVNLIANELGGGGHAHASGCLVAGKDFHGVIAPGW